MFAHIVVLGVLAAGPAKIRVEVVEYAIGAKPVPGAKVTLRETSDAGHGVNELTGLTDAAGLVWFDVPHLGFEPVEIEKDGYVTRAEMKPFLKELGKFESKQPRGPQEA